MGLTTEQAEKLVADVQVAHRLVVGFYERLLPSLDKGAETLGFEFWYWEPMHTARPCRSNTRPSKNWLWDMVPLFAATHVYKKVSGKRMKAGDMVLSFNVYIDHNFEPERRKEVGIKGKPDPITMPLGAAVIEVDLYRVPRRSNQDFEEAWGDSEHPTFGRIDWHFVHENMEARMFQVAISEFVVNPDATWTRLRAFISEPIAEPEV